jgi:hypothetical protein
LPNPFPYEPTATQFVELVQDTLVRVVPLPFGLGLGTTVQVTPFQDSIRDWAPTASQLVGDVQDTP